MWMHTCLAFFFVQNPLKHDVLTTGIVNEIPFVNDVALRFIELRNTLFLACNHVTRRHVGQLSVFA